MGFDNISVVGQGMYPYLLVLMSFYDRIRCFLNDTVSKVTELNLMSLVVLKL